MSPGKEMTGAFVRVKRDGSWQPVDFTDLTDDELDLFAEEHSGDGWKWARFLAKWIRDNVGAA